MKIVGSKLVSNQLPGPVQIPVSEVLANANKIVTLGAEDEILVDSNCKLI